MRLISWLAGPRGSVPEDQIVYAIGDVHGRDDLLRRLHVDAGRVAGCALPLRRRRTRPPPRRHPFHRRTFHRRTARRAPARAAPATLPPRSYQPGRRIRPIPSGRPDVCRVARPGILIASGSPDEPGGARSHPGAAIDPRLASSRSSSAAASRHRSVRVSTRTGTVRAIRAH